MGLRGNKPANVIIPEQLAAIVGYQEAIDKLVTEMLKEVKGLRRDIKAASKPAEQPDNRPVIEKVKDILDDGKLNRSNVTPKKTGRKVK